MKKRKEINEKVDDFSPYSMDTNIEVAIEYLEEIKKSHEKKGYRNIRLDYYSGDYYEGDKFDVHATRDETDDEMKVRIVAEKRKKEKEKQAKRTKEEKERELYLKLKKKFEKESE